MDYDIGDIVISKAGRDKGKYLMVVGFTDDRILLADGKMRKIENPKCKKIKHISKKINKSTLICDKMKCNEKVPNALIRKEIERIKEDV